MAEERKKHPISEMASERKNPLIEMNMQINKTENRGSARKSFTMTEADKKSMQRILDTAQTFIPYTKKKGP